MARFLCSLGHRLGRRAISRTSLLTKSLGKPLSLWTCQQSAQKKPLTFTSNMASSMEIQEEKPWFITMSTPVWVPSHEALTLPKDKFDAYIHHELTTIHDDIMAEASPLPGQIGTDAESSTAFPVLTPPPSTTADIRDAVKAMDVNDSETQKETTDAAEQAHPWKKALLDNLESNPHGPPANLENRMHTTNGDLAFQSSTSSLVDLFYELEDSVSGTRLRDLLEGSWNADPLLTLKVIFNARSIHLGKSSRTTFYGCAGWLAQRHPLTLVENLKWLSRPVIEKKGKKDKEGEEEDLVVVEPEKDINNPETFDVRNGVSHGYWKDLVNILALAANKKLDVLSNPKDVLNVHPENTRGDTIPIRKAGRRGGKGRSRGMRVIHRGSVRGRGGFPIAATPHIRTVANTRKEENNKTKEEENEETKEEERKMTEAEARLFYKQQRREKRSERNQTATTLFNDDRVYRALHLTIARLFAEQLQKDLVALRGSDPKAKRHISLCAKWAPSHDCFHDRHTFVVTSIAEILHPRESLDHILSPTDDRDVYLRYAREEYRKDTSALRKHLEVVERDITASTYQNIKYDRVPSVAMQNYTKLFVTKDEVRFDKYIERVASGQSRISGAVLLPSTLVAGVRVGSQFHSAPATLDAKQLVQKKIKDMEVKVADAQWNTLVQRIKDSGTLSSSIAVCDVSGSMTFPQQPDGTCPMDSAIGLSLLVAEVTEQPFGGAFISFHSKPKVHKIDLAASLSSKIRAMEGSDWGMNTDFEAVFVNLLLPMARKHNLKQEDMVKRVFVFSDMQFDAAKTGSPWTSSYDRIQRAYKEAGYEVPELVFWNLAGGYGTGMAPKPVTTDEGTCLMSGYSQGLLKAFLDNGSFEDVEAGAEEEEEAVEMEEEAVVVTATETGEVTTSEPVQKKAKIDPISMVKKAVNHPAYEMLRVVD